MFAGVTHSFGVRAVTRDAPTVHLDDMILPTAIDQKPSWVEASAIEPDRTLQTDGINHDAYARSRRQSPRFPPFRPDGPPWGGPRRSASSNAAKAAAGTRHSLPLSR